VCMGVRALSSFGNSWGCACCHTVESDDVAHALGRSRLSGVLRSRHDDTAEGKKKGAARVHRPPKLLHQSRVTVLPACTPNAQAPTGTLELSLQLARGTRPWARGRILHRPSRHFVHLLAEHSKSFNLLKSSTCFVSSRAAAACPPGFKSRSRRAPPLVFYTSCLVGCVWGFWWFPLFELHVYSSMWSQAEALSEYDILPE
jgi:hypothetical protein